MSGTARTRMGRATRDTATTIVTESQERQTGSQDFLNPVFFVRSTVVAANYLSKNNSVFSYNGRPRPSCHTSRARRQTWKSVVRCSSCGFNCSIEEMYSLRKRQIVFQYWPRRVARPTCVAGSQSDKMLYHVLPTQVNCPSRTLNSSGGLDANSARSTHDKASCAYGTRPTSWSGHPAALRFKLALSRRTSAKVELKLACPSRQQPHPNRPVCWFHIETLNLEPTRGSRMAKNERTMPSVARSSALCSFCGRRHDEVGPLVKGPYNVSICDQCCRACTTLLEGECGRLGIEIENSPAKCRLSQFGNAVCGMRDAVMSWLLSRPERPPCSFCSIHHNSVVPLAEGPDQVYICIRCCHDTATLIKAERDRMTQAEERNPYPPLEQ